MKICPDEFQQPDPDDRTVSQLEVDFYAHGRDENNTPHGLRLRKNLEKDRFELLRSYPSSKTLTVIFDAPDLGAALQRAKQEAKRFARLELQDTVCDHRGHR